MINRLFQINGKQASLALAAVVLLVVEQCLVSADIGFEIEHPGWNLQLKSSLSGDLKPEVKAIIQGAGAGNGQWEVTVDDTSRTSNMLCIPLEYAVPLPAVTGPSGNTAQLEQTSELTDHQLNPDYEAKYKCYNAIVEIKTAGAIETSKAALKQHFTDYIDLISNWIPTKTTIWKIPDPLSTKQNYVVELDPVKATKSSPQINLGLVMSDIPDMSNELKKMFSRSAIEASIQAVEAFFSDEDPVLKGALVLWSFLGEKLLQSLVAQAPKNFFNPNPKFSFDELIKTVEKVVTRCNPDRKLPSETTCSDLSQSECIGSWVQASDGHSKVSCVLSKDGQLCEDGSQKTCPKKHGFSGITREKLVKLIQFDEFKAKHLSGIQFDVTREDEVGLTDPDAIRKTWVFIRERQLFYPWHQSDPELTIFEDDLNSWTAGDIGMIPVQYVDGGTDLSVVIEFRHPGDNACWELATIASNFKSQTKGDTGAAGEPIESAITKETLHQIQQRLKAEKVDHLSDQCAGIIHVADHNFGDFVPQVGLPMVQKDSSKYVITGGSNGQVAAMLAALASNRESGSNTISHGNKPMKQVSDAVDKPPPPPLPPGGTKPGAIPPPPPLPGTPGTKAVKQSPSPVAAKPVKQSPLASNSQLSRGASHGNKLVKKSSGNVAPPPLPPPLPANKGLRAKSVKD